MDTIPDPEVRERPSRRLFSAAYKAAILDELDRATEPRAKGAILRREGLYTSHVTSGGGSGRWAAWRRSGDREVPDPSIRSRPRTSACGPRSDVSKRGSPEPSR